MNLTPMNNETNDTSCASLLYRPRMSVYERALSVARVKWRRLPTGTLVTVANGILE